MTYLRIWRNSRAFLLCLIQRRPSASTNTRSEGRDAEQKIFITEIHITPLSRALLGTPNPHAHCWKSRPEPMETNMVYYFLVWNLIIPEEFQQETSGFIRCLNGKKNKEITLCNRFMAQTPQTPGHLEYRQKTYLEQVSLWVASHLLCMKQDTLFSRKSHKKNSDFLWES